MNNAELIKALRCCIVDFNSTQSRRCNECPYRIYADGKKACENKAKRDVADALEAAEKRIAELEAKMPTVDAVHVVRCRECKKWNRYNDGIKGLCGHSDHVMPTREDFCCADGERKDGERRTDADRESTRD